MPSRSPMISPRALSANDARPITTSMPRSAAASSLIPTLLTSGIV